MTHRHTFQRARSLSQGQLFDRATRGKWEAAGAVPAHERAYAQALDIIEHHKPAYLDPQIEAQLREIIAENDAKTADEKKGDLMMWGRRMILRSVSFYSRR